MKLIEQHRLLTRTITLKSCTHFVLLPLYCVSHPAPSLITAGAQTSNDTRYKSACFVHRAAAMTTPKKECRTKNKKKGSRAPLLVITWVNKLLRFLLALVDHRCGEAGVWLPGLPVGSYHHQLLPHHCGHLGPLWCHPVHITLRYTGKGILSKVQSDWSMLISQWHCHILYVHNIYRVYFSSDGVNLWRMCKFST